MKLSTGDKVRVTETVYGNFLLDSHGYTVCATKGSTAEVCEIISDELVRIIFTDIAPLGPEERDAHDGTPYMVCQSGTDQKILERYLEIIH
jgi:hypothetical protein